MRCMAYRIGRVRGVHPPHWEKSEIPPGGGGRPASSRKEPKSFSTTPEGKFSGRAYFQSRRWNWFPFGRGEQDGPTVQSCGKQRSLPNGKACLGICRPAGRSVAGPSDASPPDLCCVEVRRGTARPGGSYALGMERPPPVESHGSGSFNERKLHHQKHQETLTRNGGMGAWLDDRVVVGKGGEI